VLARTSSSLPRHGSGAFSPVGCFRRIAAESKEATKDRGLFVPFEGGTGSTRPFIGASPSNLGSGHPSHVLQG
jgi:hypothetical protein